VALEAQRRNSDYDRGGRARKARDWKAEPRIETELCGKDAGRIGAQSIETRVTERDLSAIADQHVETGDKDKIDQKARTERYNIVVETKQRDRQQRQPDQQQ
jgi:lactate dehydrogenase-like 2-hydroxyacid dehydrogenase